MSDDFEKALQAFAERTQDKVDEVVAEASAEVLRDASARVPVETGRLRDSLETSIDGVQVGEGPRGAEAAARGARAGDVILGEWTAPYAVLAEYGNAYRAPAGFRALAVQNWPSIVAKAARKVGSK